MMRITENNIQKVSDRVYSLRQQWRCRLKVKDVVHQVASVTFLLLSIVYSFSLLQVMILDNFQSASIGMLKYVGSAWAFLVRIFSVPGNPVLSVFTVFFALYGVSFLTASVAALIVAVRFKREPCSKIKGLKYSEVSSMVTGLKIYQERINPLELFHGKLNSILSLAFSLIVTGMVAYFFFYNNLFETQWESFLGWAIFGTALLWVVHRLLLGLLTFPVALLYCFATPAPGLKRALEKKAEEIKPVYKYADKPKTTTATSSYTAAPGKMEKTIYRDWRTGEQLLRNDAGEVVNSKGEKVSVAWWD